MVPMDVRADVAVWLQHARECFGGDLPVSAAGSLPKAMVTPPVEPESGAEPPKQQSSRHPATAARPTADGGPRADAPDPVESGVQVAPRAAVAVPGRAEPAGSPADRLEALRAQAAACVRCKLSATRSNVVFGEGSAAAQVMFIGEAPGFHEDQQGRPFVGAAGQLLDKIIENAMGLRRADTYIANINKCRPPENREPEPDEVAACIPFLREQVRILQPKVIVCLGRVASSNLLGSSLPMRTLRGRELTYEGIPVVVTWHPAYLLRNPEAKRDTWEDVKRVNRLLGLPEDPRRT